MAWTKRSAARKGIDRLAALLLAAVVSLGGWIAACSGDAVVDGAVTTTATGAGAVPDAGDGGDDVPSTPGRIDCRGTFCETPRELCCIETPGAEIIWQCLETSEDESCGALLRECDEAADCAPGQVCCVPMTARPYPAYSTHCAATCDDSFYWFQLCSTSAECAGDSCVTQLCQGDPLRTCGALEGWPGYCD